MRRRPGSQTSGLVHERGYRGATDEWYTPPELFDALGLEFDLDPAAPQGGVSWIPARRHYSAIDDGLVQPWSGRVWLNPPYGPDTARWLERLGDHGDGVALVFARTDTAWFHEKALRATAVCFIAGRLRFVSGDGGRAHSGAGAPSLLLAYGLPCAIAVASAGIGPTFVVPQIGGSANPAAARLRSLRTRKQNEDTSLRMRK